ncbi:MAG: cupin-like domain-containing protein [Gemmatimonadaceae bacterium]
MPVTAAVDAMQQFRFGALFAADWVLGPHRVEKLLPRRWEHLHRRLLERVSRNEPGVTYEVPRERNLTPAEFRERYFLTGKPVVLAGAAADWPAIKKWSPEFLLQRCGQDEVEVFDAHNWRVNADGEKEAVSTSERMMPVAALLENMRTGGSWYGAFLELLDKYADLREDLDFSFIEKFGRTSRRIPWQRHVLAKMYVGGPGTSTSLHCAGVSNLYVQAHGRKKWVLIQPEFTPFMYPALGKGLNWQSRVDFRNPDAATCPLYRYVDRYETVLEPGDVLWNPPFVWHGVMNVTASIAVSLWWVNVSRAFSNNALFTVLTLCGRPNPIAMQLGISGPGTSTSRFAVHLNR